MSVILDFLSALTHALVANDGRHPWPVTGAARFLADNFLKQDVSGQAEDQQRLVAMIDDLEAAWALTRTADAAMLLCVLYDKVNRHADSLDLLRTAVRRYPSHALLRYYAASVLLRHGGDREIREFVEGVQAIDPGDAFSRFAQLLLDRYATWIRDLANSLRQSNTKGAPFLIACPVWGEAFANYLVEFPLAALLSPGNLPALSKTHDVHYVLFTTKETERFLRQLPRFSELQRYATVHFFHYEQELVGYSRSMKEGYGSVKVPYSDQTLDFYYSRLCKFALMSFCHYVALAAGRDAQALVSCQVADTLLNDGALSLMVERMATGVNAVLISSIQLDGQQVRPVLDRRYRKPDGVLTITADDCAALLLAHAPPSNFIESTDYLKLPLRICWRVGSSGALVHANHFNPICLRPHAISHPLAFSIDPTDSRFLGRSEITRDQVYFVQDTSIVGISLEDDPLLDQQGSTRHPFSEERLALWLWGYWDHFRADQLRTPIRIRLPGPPDPAWQSIEAEASSVVENVIRQVTQWEDSSPATKSWRLKRAYSGEK